MFEALNPVAIVIGTIGYMILGFVWYTAFSAVWTDAMGWSEDEMAQEGSSIGYLITTVASLVAVISLALLLNWTDASTWQDGLAVGILVGIGFVATTAVQAVPFEGRAWSVYAINAGYNIVALAGIGVLLALW